MSEDPRHLGGRSVPDAPYRVFFENSLEAMFLTTLDGSILDANPAAERLFGWPAEELRRRGRAAVVDTTDPRLAEAIAQRATTGSFRGELRALRADGSVFPAEFAAAAFRDALGRDLSSVVVRDLSGIRSAETALQESERRLELALSSAKAGAWEWELATNRNV